MKKFVGQLQAGDKIGVNEYQACQWHVRQCLLDKITFESEGEFDFAILEFTMPCGTSKTQSWYVIEEIEVFE